MTANTHPSHASPADRLRDDLAPLALHAGLPLEPPIRSELFGRARFEQHGRSLAATHEVVDPGQRGAAFFPRLGDNIDTLRRARALLERHASEGLHLGPAAHWLLDNAGLVDEQLQTVRQALPRSFFRLLPRLRGQPLAGLPRIYGVAWAWVAHTDSGLDTDLLAAYLQAYQQTRALTLAELWALPSTLRVVLLENLRRLAERTALQQVARDTAHQWLDQPADHLAGTPDAVAAALAALAALAEPLAQRGVGDAFLLQLQQREDELPTELARALRSWLLLRLPDPAAALARQQSDATEDHQSIRNAITTLRALDRVNWRQMFAGSCAVMLCLAQCPVHAQEREDCQDDTLHAVERLARQSRLPEAQVAQALLALTQGGSGQHTEAGRSATADPATSAAPPGDPPPSAAPAYWWRGPGLAELRALLQLPAAHWRSNSPHARRAASVAYLASLALLTAAAVAWLLHRHGAAAAGPGLLLAAAVLLLGPAGEAVVAMAHRLISESARPSRLPRLALEAGIPAAHRVIVVMPVMLSSGPAITALCGQLEQHHIANPEPQAQFALLSDWADAPVASSASDQPLLQAAAAAVAALNAQHPVPAGTPLRFVLLHRARQWSDTEQAFIGWERKRGKLEQLVRLLSPDEGPGDGSDRGPGHGAPPFIDLGPLSTPAPGTRYIVTLDADTDMPPGRLRALVGVAAHPLNLPRFDALSGRVNAGYGILQPRVVTPLPAPDTVTLFHTLFAGQCGIDPYSAASSELYQDVFGEGSFTGKGLLNVQAMRHTLQGRLPEGQVLSHDLIEGSLARCAGVSDITVVEDAPVHADVANARLHRWTRGDWQLLPFLWRAHRLGLPLISRWKMVDNLRRSLVAPMSLALLLLVLATGVLPLGWALLVVAAAFCAGPLLGAVAALAPSRDDIAWRLFYWQAGADLLRALALGAWHLALLLQLALMYGDAIVRALWRQAVSRRHLLQWTTAASAQAAARHDLPSLLRSHARVPLAALGLALGLAAWARAGTAPQPLLPAALLLALWAAAPLWIWLASRPQPRPRRERLDAPDQRWLRGVARDTWRFYEQHVGADDHHLPPDNVQYTPQAIVAHRTSPTNIGLYLLAATSAQALGFIGRSDLVARLGATLDTLERLPRHQGHFYNWIDTSTLAVLNPPYVSTVDSGNCSGHLLAVAQACLALAAADRSHTTDPWPAAVAASAQRLHPLRTVLDGTPSLGALAALTAHEHWPPPTDGLAAFEATLHRAQAELDSLNLGRQDAGDDSALWLLHDHVALLGSALLDLQADHTRVNAQLHRLAGRCRVLALAPDYAMLYDRERKLLHIGLRVDSQQLDDSHYDLLASESRLTSLLAIAKGDVPVAHWAALGRPFFACGTEVGLKSWSGSMFEYLMPSLVLDEPVGSVLHQVTRSAVAAQRQEAVGRGTPWGISESAIAGQDHTLAFQYGPQGVARLALRRTPVDERVIAPYASLMALVVAPLAAVANLRALQALGARRALGFIEAIDYTPQRQVAGSTSVQVHSFMAHHQAMALVALTDVLTDGAPRRWAMADPMLRAVTALLHERAPREVPELPDAAPLPAPRRSRGVRLVADVLPLSEPLPATQLLTNGRHAVMLRSHGGGHSQWDGLGLTRWRDDLLRDDLGTLFYLRRERGSDWHSLSAHPAPDPAARYTTRMQADRAVFDAQWPDLHSRCTVWLSPEDDCELRQLELSATGTQPLTLTVASYAEITLAPFRADEAHPAFSNLFVQARWHADEQALYFRRQPRLPDEAAVRAVHFLALADGAQPQVQACTDRAQWLGRYGRPQRPLGGAGLLPLDGTAPDSEPGAPGVPVDTGLDPIASLRVTLTLAPGTSVRLTYCTAAAQSLDTLSALVDKYRQPSQPARASSMSHTMAGIRLRELGFDTDTWTAMLRVNTLLTSLVSRELPAPQRLLGTGINTGSDPAAPPDAAQCDRRVLWRHGLSGDKPIVLVTIAREEGLGLVLTLKKALRLWTAAGLSVDLVVLNAEPLSYLSPVQNQLQQLRDRLRQQIEPVPAARRGAMTVLSDSALQRDERATLHALARLRLQADGRSLAQQVDRVLEDHQRDLARRLSVPSAPVLPVWPAERERLGAQPPAWRFDGPMSDVVFEVSPRRHPSRPWINVLANPGFGCQVSEVGSGFTWAGNSRLHQVTGWSNDALGDPPSEQLLLHDLDTRRVWPLGQALLGGSPRELRHGLGSTHMRQRIDGLDITLSWCVDATLAVKQLQVGIRQHAGRPRRLRLVAVAEWTLGGSRAERLSVATQPLRWTTGEAGAGLPPGAPALALAATQRDLLGGFGGATAFLALRPVQPGDAPADADLEAGQALDGAAAPAPTPPLAPLPRAPAITLSADDWTCDRRELLDAAGHAVLPARLGRQHGSGLDPCAALGCQFTTRPGQWQQLSVLLGHADSLDSARSLLLAAWPVDPAQRLRQQRAQWPALLAPVVVGTPDPAFDALVNHWLPYQTVACRLWARAGFYQAGGAYGFRDQLQDAMAMVDRAPALLAAQIRLNASRQFPEGDVQHWWHAPGGAGVRTHFSDDLLWLPCALALYLQRTGDNALADERVAYLQGAAVPPGQEDIYETPQPGAEWGTVYDHAARAIDHSLRLGQHGLPLMGSGDWNDGMNRVGSAGRGESVWLAWFLCTVVDGLLPLARARGDQARADAWAQARSGWARALDEAGWDGAWYRRAYFDDGSALGAAANPECKIDLIAQAWAVLAGAGQPQRARTAMASASRLLIDGGAGVVRLLDPPLQLARPSAGYIQSYPSGVRENGGQYNHAGVWALMALAKLGQAEAAWQVFTLLSPAHRWQQAARGAAYGLEPYVMAGDIYTQSPYVGRGGWSWYTGSAGWLARAAVESLCGVLLGHDSLVVTPCLPPHWPQASVRLQRGGRQWRIVLCRDSAAASNALALLPQARRLPAGERVALADLPDGAVRVVVQQPASAP